MKRKKLLFLFIICLPMISNSQEWVRGIKADGNQQQYKATDMSVSTSGDIVIAGYYQENLILDNLSIFTPDDYYADIYLTRINANNEVEWLQHIEVGGNYGDDIGITTDDDDNIYLTGHIDGKIFVSKYGSLGNKIWQNNFDQAHQGGGRTITIDQFDNVYVSGGSGWNFFMAKLDYHGNTVWTKDYWFNYSNAVNISDIIVDAIGNIFFIGTFEIETLTLEEFVLNHDGGSREDLLWGQIDTDGNFIWIKSSVGNSGGSPQIALTPDNNLYLSGAITTSNGLNFEGTQLSGLCCQRTNPFIAKYKTNGDMVWAKHAETTYENKGNTNDIKVDYEGNLYLTGGYYSSSVGGNVPYIEKYNSSGNNLWRDEFKMVNRSYSNQIDIDNYGNLYNVGYNYSTNFIDPNAYGSLITLGSGQLNTGASTYKKTPRPKIDRLNMVCDNNNPITLSAEGSNIKWYNDPILANNINEGNEFTPQNVNTDTLYVTQTVNNIESWPKEVIVRISELPNAQIYIENDTLFSTQNNLFKYQWYYENVLIENETKHYIVPEVDKNFGGYSVLITQETCTVELKVDTLSIFTEESKNFISVYPNPTNNNNVYLDLSSNYHKIKTIKVFDLMGREVYSKISNSFSEKETINLKGKVKGVYIVEIYGRNIHNSIKIIKN